MLSGPALELLSPATLGVVCFRRRPRGVSDEDRLAELNAGLVEELTASGRGLISSTRLRGRYALRMCVLNHTSGPADVAGVLDWIEHAELPSSPVRSPSRGHRGRDRHPDLALGWAAQSTVEAALLGALPVFESLTAPQLARAAGSARLTIAAPGETIVQRWDSSREFYVILAGSIEVRAGDKQLSDLGPGDFFGELAALDWGAGYGYARSASAVAGSEVRLLVLPALAFQALMHEAPAFAERIRGAVAERLPNS